MVTSMKGFPDVYNVKLRGGKHCIRLNEDALKKINKFSVDDCIRFRKDETTIKNIEKQYQISMNNDRIKVL